LSEEDQLSKLTQEEAAKRLAIGTKVGKYHNVAIRFCGISVADYILIRNEAITILKSLKADYSQSDQA